MFDKNLFDRNAYDRSVASDGINGTLLSSSSMTTKLVIAYPIPLTGFTGLGNMNAQLRMYIHAITNFKGEGTIEDTTMVLHLPLSFGFHGSGDLNPGLVAKVPLKVDFTGEGDMESDQDFVYQHLTFKLPGAGNLAGYLIMKTFMEEFAFSGAGALNADVILQLPLVISMTGESSFTLRRLGALNENVFELDGINLEPGETVTIDTDLLSVYFGFRQDVASVTNDSVFFELYPGENEIIIETDANGPMNVTAVWQNRWL